MTGDQLKSILLSVRENLISRKELALLIGFSQGLAGKYLTFHRPSILRLCENAGISESDLVIDITADIFGKDETDKFIELDKFTGSFDRPFEEADVVHVYFAFKKLVLHKASSRLSITYAQTDPPGAKILRNVRDQVKTVSRLEIIEDFRGKILQKKGDIPGSNRPAFPLDAIERELPSRLGHNRKIPDILSALSEIFMEQPHFRSSIPLFDFVQIVRQIYVANDDDPIIPPEKELSIIEIEEMEGQVLVYLNKVIFTKYFPKKIKTKEEADRLAAALKEIISGFWKKNGDDLSVEDSVRKHLDLNHEEYRQSWKNQAEYLVKLAKEQFAALLDNGV